MKTFKEFVKNTKTSQEKQRESATQNNDDTANDANLKQGLEQSAQISAFQKTE